MLYQIVNIKMNLDLLQVRLISIFINIAYDMYEYLNPKVSLTDYMDTCNLQTKFECLQECVCYYSLSSCFFT